MPPEQLRTEPRTVLPVAPHLRLVLVQGEGVTMDYGMGICVQTVVDEGIYNVLLLPDFC